MLFYEKFCMWKAFKQLKRPTRSFKVIRNSDGCCYASLYFVASDWDNSIAGCTAGLIVITHITRVL